ncbi:9087_t:CDS:1, partial [Racocetra persica]
MIISSDFQIKAKKVIVWIPHDRLKNLPKVKDEESDIVSMANLPK